MDLDLYINGEPVEFSLEGVGEKTTWRELSEALGANLGAQGWAISALELDGADDVAPTQELESVLHRVDVTAVPMEKVARDISSELIAGVPAFHERTLELGRAFRREELADMSTRFEGFLLQLQDVLTGFHALTALRRESPPEDMNAIPALLQDLNDNVESQSWLQVADVLTHELAPRVERLHAAEAARPAPNLNEQPGLAGNPGLAGTGDTSATNDAEEDV